MDWLLHQRATKKKPLRAAFSTHSPTQPMARLPICDSIHQQPPLLPQTERMQDLCWQLHAPKLSVQRSLWKSALSVYNPNFGKLGHTAKNIDKTRLDHYQIFFNTLLQKKTVGNHILFGVFLCEYTFIFNFVKSTVAYLELFLGSFSCDGSCAHGPH